MGHFSCSGTLTNKCYEHQAYASAYFRMSMLGVKNINKLTEISKVLPQTRT